MDANYFKGIGARQQRTGVIYCDEPRVVGGVGEINFGKQYRQGNRIYDCNAVSPCLTHNNGNASGGSVLILNNNETNLYRRIRRLTPKECFRLQGYSEEVIEKGSKGISDTQLYKIAGNSVTVNVVYEIIKKIKQLDEEDRK